MSMFIAAALAATGGLSTADIEPAAQVEAKALEARLDAQRAHGAAGFEIRVAQWNDWFNGFSDWNNWRNW